MKNEYMKKRLFEFCRSYSYNVVYIANRGVYQLWYGNICRNYPSLTSLYNSVFVNYDYLEDDCAVRLF